MKSSTLFNQINLAFTLILTCLLLNSAPTNAFRGRWASAALGASVARNNAQKNYEGRSFEDSHEYKEFKEYQKDKRKEEKMKKKNRVDEQ